MATEMCTATSPRQAGTDTIHIPCEKSAKHNGPHLAGGYTWTIDRTGQRHHTKVVPGGVL